MTVDIQWSSVRASAGSAFKDGSARVGSQGKTEDDKKRRAELVDRPKVLKELCDKHKDQGAHPSALPAHTAALTLQGCAPPQMIFGAFPFATAKWSNHGMLLWYAEISVYPMPGRVLRVGLRLAFASAGQLHAQAPEA